ncbi:putative zinc finger motif, C2HC5-type-domain-containing protein [Sphaerosporella brunnea]|uniref:Putative zinc finger motif, C2HC5-type-domain-containing protein n=1 Tax=Sphaerosporella brunnea TaxID=1250544 RepID=A0A5J5EZP3_9PEZI|nr:putative zinc finger motif, C2HC5-type-domain-containing protein [Sphaerosporella brunnea]
MANPTPIQSWALPQLKPILDYLPDEDLLEAISYAASLPSAEEVATHFKNLLGDSAQALSFISDFNSRLFQPKPAAAPASNTTHPRSKKSNKKGKPPLNRYAQEERKANDGQSTLFANQQGVYIKKDADLEDDFYSGKSRKSTPKPSSQKPTPKASPYSSSTNLVSTASYAAISKPAPSTQQGKLTSDLVAPKKQPPQKQEKYVYTTTGGTAMRGASQELTDLESALRALEISTNPTLNTARRLCSCQGLTHEVLQATPNCLNCGKIICLKEGLGPCTFCGTALISTEEIQEMVRSLREAAGNEKMAINAQQNKRAEVAKTPRPFATAGDEESFRKAQEHRDRLLGFQATGAQRTRIIDQAADFETPLSSGLNQWTTPAERALQLKRQQQQMRMMDWHAKEAYEKRKVVVAIDLKGRKVVRQMQEEAPPEFSDDEPEAQVEYDDSIARGGKGKEKEVTVKEGTYSKNPLLKGLIKPVYELRKKKGKETNALGSIGGYSPAAASKWRRVQDDFADNEDVILDGGVSGAADTVERGDEIPCG